VFRNPQGRAVPNVPRPRNGHEVRMRHAIRARGSAIGATTCMPIGRGERMDHAMAVDGLLQVEGRPGRVAA
ncbi:MAG: hypothetical protein ACRDJY_07580, partial [Thermoleophilaceae bacterium]